MGMFRRKSAAAASIDPRTAWPEQPVPADPRAAAAAFWRQWEELLPDVSAALGDGAPGRVEYTLCAAVALLHPQLQFSLERGQRAVYALVISGQEDPELRPYTDAWAETAPADDAIWEYHDSVPPVPDPTGVAVNIGGHRIELGEVRVVAQLEDSGSVVDVAVYHPLLAELDEQARTAMTFLPLDAALGERLAAQWLGRVETAETEPSGTISLLQLRELVEGLATSTDDDVGGAD